MRRRARRLVATGGLSSRFEVRGADSELSGTAWPRRVWHVPRDRVEVGRSRFNDGDARGRSRLLVLDALPARLADPPRQRWHKPPGPLQSFVASDAFPLECRRIRLGSVQASHLVRVVETEKSLEGGLSTLAQMPTRENLPENRKKLARAFIAQR